VVVGATLPAIVVREGASGNDVLGNFVGLSSNGTSALPNAGNDLLISGANFPVPSTIAAGVVSGVLESEANATFTVELFMSAACDGSGFGEGEVFLGAVEVATNALGRAPFSIVPSQPLIQRRVLSATATNAAGSTSEFSNCLALGFLADGFESANTSKWSAAVPAPP
jgi:hypothetical protein